MPHLRTRIPLSLILLLGTAAAARAQSAPSEDRSSQKERPAHASAPREAHEKAPPQHQSAPQPHADAPQQHQSAHQPRANAPQQHQSAPPQHPRAPQQDAPAPQPRTRIMKRHAPAPAAAAPPAASTKPQPGRQQAAAPAPAAKPAGHAPRSRPADAPAPTPQVRQWQQGKSWQHGNGWRGSQDWHSSRAHDWKSEHRDWSQRGGYGGYQIPVTYYQSYYGPTNYFRMESQPVIYMGYPRFMYGGYSFLIVDPYPEYWVENWYDTEDVYIVWDNGYYLYNRSNPNVSLSVSVMF